MENGELSEYRAALRCSSGAGAGPEAALAMLVYHSHGIEVDYTVDNKAALGEGGFGQVIILQGFLGKRGEDSVLE